MRRRKQVTGSCCRDVYEAKLSPCDAATAAFVQRYDWYRLVLVAAYAVVLYVGSRWSQYLKLMHENEMYFSAIRDVEREISFRTESGLYYSYYKQLVSARWFFSAVRDLTRDKLTEHPSTINVLARMNIYQEVLLAAFYRLFPANNTEPVYFYIDVIFSLHGLLVCSLFVLSWNLSGSWFAGLLTSLFYIFNRVDVTRVEQWIPLRENFALPFLWSQLAVLTIFFRPTLSLASEKYCRSAIAVFTFLFAVTWQFNQFALLLQAMALFAVQVLQLVEHRKIFFVYLCHIGSMTAVSVLQFFNPMIITGYLLSFIAAALFIMWLQSRMSVSGSSRLRCLLQVTGYVMLVFMLTFLINIIVKLAVRQDADEHIYKFVLVKFGFSEYSRDFDVNLYLCNTAFSYLDFAIFERLSRGVVFPIYAAAHSILLVLLVAKIFQSWQQNSVQKQCNVHDKHSDGFTVESVSPMLAYHCIQAVFFGAVALMTLRMKFFWTPYMCIIASVSLVSRRLWAWILARLRCHSPVAVQVVRYSVVVITIIGLLFMQVPRVLAELDDLREFYDPDTVDLMEWIKSNTSPRAAFAGSMQLLAGVKLCTGRPITNHPHYEDKALRHRTKELYQMYGRRTADEVFEIMTKYSVSYIIVEDSHCVAPSRDGCRLPDLIDIDNGFMPDDGAAEHAGLVESDVPRFCDNVRHGLPSYNQYFTLVFDNPTFRVYSVANQRT